MSTISELIFAFLIAVCIGSVRADDRNFTHLTVKDGLANSTVYFSMQDSKGYIWLCTETGVNRYDGHRFETFTIRDGLADNENFKCVEDSRGRIWFLSYNGKLAYFYKGAFYNSSNTPLLNRDPKDAFLFDCKEDKKGVIWFSTVWGDVFKVTDRGITSYPLSSMYKSYHYTYCVPPLFLENDSIKKFVINENDHTLYKLNLNSNKYSLAARYSSFGQLMGIRMESAAIGKSLFFISAAGLMRYNFNSKPEVFFPLNELKVQGRILSFFFDGNDLWLGTSGSGLLRYRIENGRATGTGESFLRGDIVTHIFKDHEDNIWVNTHGNGVFILKNNARFFTTIPSDLTYSIAFANRMDPSKFIVGCGNGKILFVNNNTIVKTVQVNNNPFNRILDIIPRSESMILIGCDEGLFNYDLKTYIVSRVEPNMVSYKNSDLDKNGNLWICSEGKGLAKVVDGRYHEIKNKLKFFKYTAVAGYSDTTYYIGTTSSLYFANCSTGAYKLLLSDSVLRAGIIDLKLINGQLWVATHGNGIFILKDQHTIRHLTMRNDGIINDVCQRLYDDGKRFVWLATNKGLSVIDHNTFELYRNLSSNKGLASDDIKDIVVNNEKAYVATAGGTSVFRLRDINFTAAPPNVFVTSLSCERKEFIEPDSVVVVDYTRSYININYTAITFLSPQDVSYQYKFENELAWNPTRNAEISLFGLEPGTHQILFRAKKYNSSWSTPLYLTIIVNPLWFQAMWLKLLVVIMLGLGIYLGFKRRILLIHQRAEEKNEYQRKIIDLESKTLIYQMNPHFIFNSLNTVQQFILEKDEEQGLNYLSDFASLMRQILQNTSKSSITLHEETAFLERYLQLERIRFNNKFDYRIRVSNKLNRHEIKIPPVFIQPLVENAIKYGVSLPDKRGWIEISLSLVDNFLLCVVEDNGNGIYSTTESKATLSLKKESTALKLTEERLRLITNTSGETGRIHIIDKGLLNQNNSGTRIEIYIPILT